MSKHIENNFGQEPKNGIMLCTTAIIFNATISFDRYPKMEP